MSRLVLRWYLRISRSATVPGRNRCGFSAYSQRTCRDQPGRLINSQQADPTRSLPRHAARGEHWRREPGEPHLLPPPGLSPVTCPSSWVFYWPSAWRDSAQGAAHAKLQIDFPFGGWRGDPKPPSSVSALLTTFFCLVRAILPRLSPQHHNGAQLARARVKLLEVQEPNKVARRRPYQ